MLTEGYISLKSSKTSETKSMQLVISKRTDQSEFKAYLRPSIFHGLPPIQTESFLVMGLVTMFQVAFRPPIIL